MMFVLIQGSRGIAASAFELTGNKYHHAGNNGSISSSPGGVSANLTSAMLGLHGNYHGSSSGGIASSAVTTGNNSPVPPSSSPRAHHGMDSASLVLAGSSGLGTRYQRSVTLDNSGIASTTAAAAVAATAANRLATAGNGSNTTDHSGSGTTLPKLNIR